MASHSTTICIMLVFVCTVYSRVECSEEGPSKRLVLDGNGVSYDAILAKLNKLTTEVQSLRIDAVSSRYEQVSFMTYMTENATRQNDSIVFDDVHLNLGSIYNEDDGNFIAPLSGVYQFSITACAIAGHEIVLDLKVNGAVVGKVLAGDSGVRDCSSRAFIQRLAVGDDVFVQNGTTGDYLDSTPLYNPSFSGVLLYTVAN